MAEGEAAFSGKKSKREVLGSQARVLVASLREYFEKEMEKGGPLMSSNKVVERTAAALNLSRSTVLRIGMEKYHADEQGTSFKSPNKKRIRQKPVTCIDAFTQDAIRQHLYNDYYEKREYPTLHKLVVSLKNKKLFEGSISSLSRVIHGMGFKFVKHDSRKILMERRYVVEWRFTFVQQIVTHDFEDIVWLDETWVNANHSPSKCWSDGSSSAVIPVPTGKGERLIITHAGTSKGFIPNSLLIFQSKKTGNFHEEMNGEKFKNWFQDVLLKNLEKPSIIVMDNASYHSVIVDKAPPKSARKAVLVDWLQRHNVQAGEHLMKFILEKMVAENKPNPPRYEIDEIAKRNGHTVLRLPPYHCHFNPIEIIWAQVKGYVAKNNKKFTITEVETLFKEGIEKVTAENWHNAVDHATDFIMTSWHQEVRIYSCIDSMKDIQFTVNNDSSNSFSSSDNESDCHFDNTVPF